MLVLTTTFPKEKDDYGTPRFVFDLALNLSKKGIDTIVLTPDRPKSNLSKENINEKLTVQRYRYFNKKMQNLTTGEGIIPLVSRSKFNGLLIFFLVFSQFIHSLRLIKRNRFSVINSHWLVPSGLLGAVFQRIFGIKNIVTIHAAGLHLLERLSFGKRLAKFVYKNSTKILVVSNFGKKRFYNLLSKPDKPFFNSKVKVIPMGVYTKQYKTKAKNSFNSKEFNILFIGRIVEKKGLEYAIRALKLVENFPAKLHICGFGPLRTKLESLVEENGLKNQVQFYGKISEKQKIQFLNSADILLVPSIETEQGDKEGLPVVILEAVSAKLPVIACDIGGIGDGVLHNQTGILIKSKCESCIHQAISELNSNREKLRKLSNNCDSFSKKFDWEEIAKRYIEEIIS